VPSFGGEWFWMNWQSSNRSTHQKYVDFMKKKKFGNEIIVMDMILTPNLHIDIILESKASLLVFRNFIQELIRSERQTVNIRTFYLVTSHSIMILRNSYILGEAALIVESFLR
jgi:hypothetical protein